MYEARRPAWVIIGWNDGPYAMVLASTELNQAQLELERDQADWGEWFDRTFLPPPRYTLSVEMRRYVVVQAPTFQDALARLFGQWSPEPARPPAVGA